MTDLNKYDWYREQISVIEIKKFVDKEWERSDKTIVLTDKRVIDDKISDNLTSNIFE